MNDLENSGKAVENIEEIIKKLNGNLKGVYIDSYNSSDNFSALTSEDLNSLDVLYMNQEPKNDFDAQLIKELSKAADFKINYFHEL